MNRPGSLTHVSCANSKKLISSINARRLCNKIDSGNPVGRIRVLFASMAFEIRARGQGVRSRARPSTEASSWHVQQGRSLAKGDSYRWAAYAAFLLLAVVLFTFLLAGSGELNPVLPLAATALVLAIVFFRLSIRSRRRQESLHASCFIRICLGSLFIPMPYAHPG